MLDRGSCDAELPSACSSISVSRDVNYRLQSGGELAYRRCVTRHMVGPLRFEQQYQPTSLRLAPGTKPPLWRRTLKIREGTGFLQLLHPPSSITSTQVRGPGDCDPQGAYANAHPN